MTNNPKKYEEPNNISNKNERDWAKTAVEKFKEAKLVGEVGREDLRCVNLLTVTVNTPVYSLLAVTVNTAVCPPLTVTVINPKCPPLVTTVLAMIANSQLCLSICFYVHFFPIFIFPNISSQNICCFPLPLFFYFEHKNSLN